MIRSSVPTSFATMSALNTPTRDSVASSSSSSFDRLSEQTEILLLRQPRRELARLIPKTLEGRRAEGIRGVASDSPLCPYPANRRVSRRLA